MTPSRPSRPSRSVTGLGSMLLVVLVALGTWFVSGGEPGRATVWTRRSGIVAARQVFDANTPHLAGFEPAEAFAFQ